MYYYPNRNIYYNKGYDNRLVGGGFLFPFTLGFLAGPLAFGQGPRPPRPPRPPYYYPRPPYYGPIYY